MNKVRDKFNYVCWECGAGWFPLVESALIEIDKYCSRYDIPLPYISQIKEKNGFLNIYFMQDDDFILSELHLNNIIKIAERYEIESRRYCQICGVGINERSRANHHTMCASCDVLYYK